MSKPPSPIRIDGNTAYIFLKEGFEAAIDLADIPLVEHRRWRALIVKTGHAYACSGQTISKDFILLHRLLLNVPRDRYVDHADGDGLNNRRKNIRPATGAQNNANIAVTRRNKLGIKGVHLDERGRYKATIKSDNKTIHLGRFKTPEEASAAYRGAARILFKEFARG